MLHVVHDYANLVSSGTMAINGEHSNDKTREPVVLLDYTPLNHHVGEAFLMNCRKLYDFFMSRGSQGDDIRARDFLANPPTFCLPTWGSLSKQMNKQLLHVTRCRGKVWNGQRETQQLLAEFMNAWELFLSQLQEPYLSEFRRRLVERNNVTGFDGLNLGLGSIG